MRFIKSLFLLPIIASYGNITRLANNNETVGTFDVVSGENYSIKGDKISASSSNTKYLLKDNSGLSDNFHFSFKTNLSLSDSKKDYAFVLHGSLDDGKLSGDYFKPYLAGNTWRVKYGTVDSGIYNEILDITADFGTHFLGNFDLYLYNGVLAFRMDNWAIGTIEMVYQTGETYILSNSSNLSVKNPVVSTLENGIGSYIYRNQWGGYNHWGYTRCFNKDQSHSFSMSLPNGVDVGKVDKFYLSRFAPNRTNGQLAGVKINGVESENYKNSSTNASHSDQIYNVDKSLIDDKNAFNFEIKTIENEYCVSNYKLLYEIDGAIFVADSLILGSSTSEKAHNFIMNGQGWTGAQYLFVDAKGNKDVCIVGNTPKKEILYMKSPENIEPQNIDVDLTDDNTTIDFSKYAPLASAYSYTAKLSLKTRELGNQEFDGTSFTFSSPSKGTYTIQYTINDFDESNGVSEYIVKTGGEFVVGDYVYQEYIYKTVNFETDVEGLNYDGFVRCFNEKANHNIELGTYDKNSTISFEFYGAAISLCGYRGLLGGNFNVKIDGKDKGNYSSYGETNKYNVTLARIYGLDDTKHKLEITTLEDKWYAFDYFSIDIPDQIYFKTANLAQIGKIITSSPNPTGGGNKDLNVIRNEIIYPVGSSNLGPSQYDSFVAPGNENTFYMGYEFDEPVEVSKVCYQMGCTWNTGGWFRNGTLHLEGLINNEWKTIELKNELGYPNSDSRVDFTECSIYYFIFEKVEVKGIRIIGEAGGSEHFVSVSQIEVYQEETIKSFCEGRTYKDNIFKLNQ